MITVDYIKDNYDAYVIHESEQERIDLLHKRFKKEESEDNENE